MKRFCTQLLLFLPVAAASVLLLTWLLGGTGWLRNVRYHQRSLDYSHTRLREAASTHDVDVLFLGSSHSYRTFDTRIFAQRGLRTFNLGSSNQTPAQTELLLQRYLDTLRPRLVVMEVHPDIMAHDGVESTLSLLATLPPSRQKLRLMGGTTNMRVLLTGAYALMHDLIEGDRFSEPTEGEGHRYVAGGYVERHLEHYSPQPQPPTAIEPLPKQRRALQRCLLMLRQRGISVLLVEVPDTRVLTGSYTNLDQFRREMAAYGAPFFCQPLVELDDSLHFYDPGHLNQRGVDLYCTALRDSVIIPTLDRL